MGNSVIKSKYKSKKINFDGYTLRISKPLEEEFHILISKVWKDYSMKSLKKEYYKKREYMDTDRKKFLYFYFNKFRHIEYEPIQGSFMNNGKEVFLLVKEKNLDYRSIKDENDLRLCIMWIDLKNNKMIGIYFIFFRF